jgi:hypothetical protein
MMLCLYKTITLSTVLLAVSQRKWSLTVYVGLRSLSANMPDAKNSIDGACVGKKVEQKVEKM